MKKPPASLASMKNLLRKWAEAESPTHRKFVGLTVKELKEKLKEINPTASARAGKENLVNQLVEEFNAKKERMQRVNEGEAAYQRDEVDPVLMQVLKASFLKPLKGEVKEYCRKGHAMEPIFMAQLMEHSSNGLTGPYKIDAIHSTPLVKHANKLYYVDSADGELVYHLQGNSDDENENECEVDKDIKCMPIEFKSRLSLSTFVSERNAMAANLGAEVWENGEPVYIHKRADDPDLFKWIPRTSENFQLLHHVAIRGCDRGLIVVGNDRKIMFGVFVEYPEELRKAYLEVLGDLYDRALDWAYGPASKIPKENIRAVLESNGMKQSKIGLHSFLTSFFIWRRLRVDRNEVLLPTPFPPCNRILPLTHSFWNNMKGASDTATKLFWNCQTLLPSPCSQTTVLGRFFHLFAVALHRQIQFATANPNLDKYPSLFHLRNSRTKDWPYQKVLGYLTEWLVMKATPSNSLQLEMPSSPTSPRRRMGNPRRRYSEALVVDQTHATPKRGRSATPKGVPIEKNAHFERLERCRGNLCETEKIEGKQVKNRCSVCETKTKYICTGCRQHYCFVNRDEKIKQLISENNPKVAFLGGIRPPATLRYKNKEGKVLFSVVNSCFHMRHKLKFDKQDDEGEDE